MTVHIPVHMSIRQQKKGDDEDLIKMVELLGSKDLKLVELLGVKYAQKVFFSKFCDAFGARTDF